MPDAETFAHIMETTRPATEQELALWGEDWDHHTFEMRVEIGDTTGFPQLWMIEKRVDGESVA